MYLGADSFRENTYEIGMHLAILSKKRPVICKSLRAITRDYFLVSADGSRKRNGIDEANLGGSIGG